MHDLSCGGSDEKSNLLYPNLLNIHTLFHIIVYYNYIWWNNTEYQPNLIAIHYEVVNWYGFVQMTHPLNLPIIRV